MSVTNSNAKEGLTEEFPRPSSRFERGSGLVCPSPTSEKEDATRRLLCKVNTLLTSPHVWNAPRSTAPEKDTSKARVHSLLRLQLGERCAARSLK